MSITVEVTGPKHDDPNRLAYLAKSVGKTYIAHVFLVSSLAAPGACDFYLAKEPLNNSRCVAHSIR